MNKISIHLVHHKYNIYVKENIFDYVTDFHLKNFKDSKAYIITDHKVKKLYLEELKNKFYNKKITTIINSVKPGEGSKSFIILEQLINKVLMSGISRNDIIYALGGGVIGDLTGFLASVILRGIRYVQIPTTLLSQVDSSVGGKTGINSKNGKNLIGSFFQPSAVFIDPLTLKSLPQKDFLAGYAEVIKYSLINDKKFFFWLNKNIQNILNLELNVIKKIIIKCCKKKANIVKLDEKEKNIRILLNLGHTFAHSIEAETKYTIRHGEAVSVGLLMAMELSRLENLSSYKDVELLESHLKKSKLPIKLKDLKKNFNWKPENLINNMNSDKKINRGNIRFILCNGIGNTKVKENITKNVIKKSIEKYL